MPEIPPPDSSDERDGEAPAAAVRSERYARPDLPGLTWADALEELGRAQTYWLATSRPDGRPHVVPVLAVVTDGVVHLAASPDTRKARNLAGDPRATLTTHGERFDLVVEGELRRCTATPALQAVARAYDRKYGWPVTVADDALHGDGAPTAGPPPYHVLRLRPERAYGFPTADDVPATRWTFAVPGGRVG